MMKNIWAYALLVVASPACLAPADELTHEGSPDVGAAASQLSKVDVAHLPVWNIYLLGPDLHKNYQGVMVYYDSPKDSDIDARVIAVRVGDEGKPDKWVDFRLEMYRYLGNEYFEKMIRDGKLTLLDLLAIGGVMESYKASGLEPPLISTLSMPPANPGSSAGKVGREQVPYGPPLPPGWGDSGNDHRGGPTGSTDPRGHDPHQYPNGNTPGAGGPPGTPAGVTQGAPVPGTEAGSCDGKPCWGADRTKGIEWKRLPVPVKWSDKVVKFFDGAREDVRNSLRHTLFNDGKEPLCTQSCNQLASVALASMWTGIMLICVAATDGLATGPCLSGVSGSSVAALICLPVRPTPPGWPTTALTTSAGRGMTQKQRQMLDVFGSYIVSMCFVFRLYTGIVDDCRSCVAVHSKALLIIVVFGMIGASELLKAVIELVCQAVARFSRRS